MATEKIIFAGSKAFEVFKKRLCAVHECDRLLCGEITIVKNDVLKPDQMVTIDPDLVEIFKTLEQNGSEY